MKRIILILTAGMIISLPGYAQLEKLSAKVKALVSQSCRLSGEAAKKSLKIAYRKYVVLDPSIMKKDFAKSRKIHQAFRRAHGAVKTNHARYIQSCHKIEKIMVSL